MLRITVVDLSDNVVVLRVEGRITGCWVEELRRTCAAHAFAAHTFADEVQLSLELSKVSFADALGLHSSKNCGVAGPILSAPPHSWPNSSRIGHHSMQPKGY
jgi:hypothetical protein